MPFTEPAPHSEVAAQQRVADSVAGMNDDDATMIRDLVLQLGDRLDEMERRLGERFNSLDGRMRSLETGWVTANQSLGDLKLEVSEGLVRVIQHVDQRVESLHR
jgi:hypothetical protein